MATKPGTPPPPAKGTPGTAGPGKKELLGIAAKGHALYLEGQYGKARVIFEGLAALDPAEAYYKTALGALHLAENRADEALAVLNEAVELDGNDLSARVHRGEAHLRKDDPLNAARDFRKAMELDPQGKDPLTKRARALAAAALKLVGSTPEELGLPRVSAPKPAAPGRAAPPATAGKPAPKVPPRR